MLLRLHKSETINTFFFAEKKLVFLGAEIMTRYDSGEKQLEKTEKGYIFQIGSYTKNIRNILNVEKLKNIDKPINFKKGNRIYSISPDHEKKDIVNVIIQEEDEKNPGKIKKLSIFSFVDGKLSLKRDVHGVITSRELLQFFHDYNIQLKEVDLIVKKEYEFFLIKKRLPGIFCPDWKMPFKRKLHAHGEELEVKNSSENIEFSYTTKKGETLKWKMNKDYLLISGNLDKLLFVFNKFAPELVEFDQDIDLKIKNEKDEYQSRMENLNMLFTPENGIGRVRNFAKEYKKNEGNRLLISGNGDEIIFVSRHSGAEQKWIYNADKKIQPGSSSLRDLSLVLNDFRKECNDLKEYLKQKEVEKKKTDAEMISFISKHPETFMKQNENINLKDKEGSELRIQAFDAFNAEGSKFFLTYKKGGTAKHFYFAEKSLQSQMDDASSFGPPFGAERSSAMPGENKKTYFFNTDSKEMLSILKEFEPQLQQKSLT